MKLCALLLLLSLTQACTKPTKGGPADKPSVVMSPEEAEPEPFKSLRREAQKRDLHWDIHCTSLEGEEGYGGWAAPEDSWLAVYVEDGAKPWWGLAEVYSTRELAAKALLRLIRQTPNIQPTRREKKHKKQCLAAIGSNAYYRPDCKECTE